LVGGVGPTRTPKLVAQFAHEWNAMFLTPEQFKEANHRIDEALKKENRDSNSLRRSMMTGCFFGHTDSSLKQKLEARGRTLEEMHQRGMIAGSADTVKEQLQRLEENGLQRIMLQWLDLEDLDGLKALAKAIL
jgi:alkanesulfonate monooxygenase SsuD/methylene tetrahydromethanopterin reductase-like flavin-dependent oxidoreductase (luciferase family)